MSELRIAVEQSYLRDLMANTVSGVAVSQAQYDTLKVRLAANELVHDYSLSGAIGMVTGLEVRIVPDGEPAPEGFKDLR